MKGTDTMNTIAATTGPAAASTTAGAIESGGPAIDLEQHHGEAVTSDRSTPGRLEEHHRLVPLGESRERVDQRIRFNEFSLTVEELAHMAGPQGHRDQQDE